MTGCQASDDLDGLLGPLMAEALDLPYLGVVTAVRVDASGSTATVTKEYAGGVRGDFEVALPAVLGIQAAEAPPRYVPVAKVRAGRFEGNDLGLPLNFFDILTTRPSLGARLVTRGCVNMVSVGFGS